MAYMTHVYQSKQKTIALPDYQFLHFLDPEKGSPKQ